MQYGRWKILKYSGKGKYRMRKHIPEKGNTEWGNTYRKRKYRMWKHIPERGNT
jgi:hypothetical protein